MNFFNKIQKYLFDQLFTNVYEIAKEQSLFLANINPNLLINSLRKLPFIILI